MKSVRRSLPVDFIFSVRQNLPDSQTCRAVRRWRRGHSSDAFARARAICLKNIDFSFLGFTYSRPRQPFGGSMLPALQHFPLLPSFSQCHYYRGGAVKMMTDRQQFFDSLTFQEQYHCDVPLGSFCGPQGTAFRLWAPTAQAVTLRLYQAGTGECLLGQFPLNREAGPGTKRRRFRRRR